MPALNTTRHKDAPPQREPESESESESESEPGRGRRLRRRGSDRNLEAKAVPEPDPEPEIVPSPERQPKTKPKSERTGKSDRKSKGEGTYKSARQARPGDTGRSERTTKPQHTSKSKSKNLETIDVCEVIAPWSLKRDRALYHTHFDSLCHRCEEDNRLGTCLHNAGWCSVSKGMLSFQLVHDKSPWTTGVKAVPVYDQHGVKHGIRFSSVGKPYKYALDLASRKIVRLELDGKFQHVFARREMPD